MQEGKTITYHQNYPGRNVKHGLWDKTWKDNDGHTVIYQRPNIWIFSWVLLDIVAIFAPNKRVTDIAWTLGVVVLIIWSLLEIIRGVNYFRRILGLTILLVTIASIFKVGL